MKKISIFLNVLLCILLACSLYYFVTSCITLPITINTYNMLIGTDPEQAVHYHQYVVNGSITLVVNIVFFTALTISLILFNYRFDGVSMREKIAARLVESKEKRAQYRAKKTEEDKQKRLEKLQAEMNELKKD